MRRRSPETLADYLVVAICPALIVLLVGSLMWFLVEVFYQGEYKWRLLWIMAMFVIAIVGIARISIEEGMAYASMFGAALAGAVALALVRLVQDGVVVGGPIMLLIWWAAHKLTWDCTLIDDAQDVSGQGLLQQMGLDPAVPSPGNAPPGTTTHSGEIEATIAADKLPERPWWETLLEPDRRPHAPGVWVVYFSLAALPLFGIGGWFVTDPVARAGVFSLLVIYVASGLGLLLATSFLGLRRYLWQRKLQMPMEMTTTWILVGIVMIVATLIVAAILPRPSREYSLSQLPFTVTSAVRRATRFAVGKEGTKDDATKGAAKGEANDDQSTDRSGGNRGGESPSNQQSNSSDSSRQQEQSQAGGSGGKGGEGKGAGDSGKTQSSSAGKGSQGGKSQSSGSKEGESKGRNAEANSDNQASRDSQNKAEQDSSKSEEQRQQQQSNQNSTRSQRDQAQQPPAQSEGSPSRISFNPVSLIGKLLGVGVQWLFYGVLAIGLLVAAWIYREELRAAWKKLMDELRELWEGWFGKKRTAEEAAIPLHVTAPPRTFASFADPFLSGDARLMPWPQLVRYTFEALEAWGREHECPRAAGQTPQEFALALSVAEPLIAPDVQSLAGSYNQLAYASRAAAGTPEQLRPLWTALRARPATTVAL